MVAYSESNKTEAKCHCSLSSCLVFPYTLRNKRSCVNPWLHTNMLSVLPAQRLTSPFSSLVITCALLPPPPPPPYPTTHSALEFPTLSLPSLHIQRPRFLLPPPPPPPPLVLSTSYLLVPPLQFKVKLSFSFTLLSKHNLSWPLIHPNMRTIICMSICHWTCTRAWTWSNRFFSL